MDDSESRTSNANLNRLRAAVLGANDGIVSVSSIILGVAGATNSRHTIFTAGLAGLVAGAMSMAVGEYVSVYSQRDTEEAFIAREKARLRKDPAHEVEGLAHAYEKKGLSSKTAMLVAKELSAIDSTKAHIEVELGIDEDDLNNPVQAATASMISFLTGGLIPLIAVLASSMSLRIPITFIAVLLALCITGYLSATAGQASRKRAIIRVIIGGVFAMIITYAIGHLFKTVVS